MIQRILPLSLIASAIFFFSGCTISQRVSPTPSGLQIQRIYVQRNPNVHMDGLHPEIVQQLKSLGFAVESFDKEKPQEAIYWLTYTANWNWDMAMYLTYFHATLLQNSKIIGEADYDARMGGANMGKFGKTAEKIRPLLIQLLQNVDRPKTVPSLGRSG